MTTGLSEDRSALPVCVLTGFLGSGKTTLLRQLLAGETFGETAVLVNEFGEVGIDHLLVDAISPDVVLLDSGCVCCQIRGELRDAVLALLSQRGRDGVPAFQRILIETTGLAEPGPVVSTLAMDTVLARQIRVGTIVTVVDTVSAMATAARQREWFEQVAVADTLVLSKTDLVSSEQVAVLSAHLATLNPAAPVIDAHSDAAAIMAAFDASSHTAWLLDRSCAVEERSANAPETRRPAEGTVDGFQPVSTQPAAQTGHLDRNLRSLVMPLQRTIDWTSFGIWFSALIHAHGDRILRVKGLVDVGETGPMLLNSVQHSVYPPEHLSAWPDGAVSRLVFIVDDIDPAVLEASFDHYVQSSSELPGPD